MALTVVQFNTLLMRGTCDKEARIRQHPELPYGSVMALLAPWWGRRIGVAEAQIGHWKYNSLGNWIQRVELSYGDSEVGGLRQRRKNKTDIWRGHKRK